MNDFLNTILTGGVAVALITVVGQLLIWYLNDKKLGNKEDEEVTKPVLVEAFDELTEMQYILDRVVSNTSVDRFLVLKTENGGGKPRLGSHLYASVMYESVAKKLKSVKDDYQRLLVDEIYVKMLSDIGLAIPNKLKVSDMREGILRSIYEVEGITYSEVHYVGETDDAFFYLSVASGEEGNTFDKPMDRVEIEIAISKIRNIFEDVIEGND